MIKERILTVIQSLIVHSLKIFSTRRQRSANVQRTHRLYWTLGSVLMARTWKEMANQPVHPLLLPNESAFKFRSHGLAHWWFSIRLHWQIMSDVICRQIDHFLIDSTAIWAGVRFSTWVRRTPQQRKRRLSLIQLNFFATSMVQGGALSHENTVLLAVSQPDRQRDRQT